MKEGDCPPASPHRIELLIYNCATILFSIFITRRDAAARMCYALFVGEQLCTFQIQGGPRMKTIPYRESDHGDFQDEWLHHRRTSGWWYVTGYFEDELKNMYSYQFTLIRPYLFGLSPYVLQLALTDFKNDRHHYTQRVKMFNRNVTITKETIRFEGLSTLHNNPDDMDLFIKTKDFELALQLDKNKGAFWHCDNGVLIMGLPDQPGQRTVYYSYPNMPTRGRLTMPGEERAVAGKSWFDRQYGPFDVKNQLTHWEWFSLRFFDDEEIMLFSFPQNDYGDGTYITRDRVARQLREYSIVPREFIEVIGQKFSHGWKVIIPGVKDEAYEIRPLSRGQMNLGYFELLAEILNAKAKRVGYCFVELLAGARNSDKKPELGLLLRSTN